MSLPNLDVEVEIEGFIHMDSDASVAIATADKGESGDNRTLEDKEDNGSGDDENVRNVM
jgi:hypothetical protein